MIPLLRITVVMALSLGAAHAIGANLKAGRALAANSCSACHGVNGIGIIDLYPNLAGQKAAYLVSQLKAYRDGTRASPIMAPLAKPLSNRQMDDVAAYYQSLGSRACSPAPGQSQ